MWGISAKAGQQKMHQRLGVHPKAGMKKIVASPRVTGIFTCVLLVELQAGARGKIWGTSKRIQSARAQLRMRVRATA